jgi:hypothetical protein
MLLNNLYLMLKLNIHQLWLNRFFLFCSFKYTQTQSSSFLHGTLHTAGKYIVPKHELSMLEKLHVCKTRENQYHFFVSSAEWFRCKLKWNYLQNQWSMQSPKLHCTWCDRNVSKLLWYYFCFMWHYSTICWVILYCSDELLDILHRF